VGSAMFDEGRLRSQRMADFSIMKAAFAHLSPVVPAVLAVAIAVSLTVFLLPGAGPQTGPTPLLTSLGGAAGRMAADLPPAAKRHAPEHVQAASAAAQLATTLIEPVPHRQPAVAKTHRAHGRSRARFVRRTPAAHVHVGRTAVPAASAPARGFVTSSGTARGQSQNHHGRGHSAAGGAFRAHGHGKALGHSSEHHHRHHDATVHGHSKKPPHGSPPAPGGPKGQGGGNGPRGGKK